MPREQTFSVQLRHWRERRGFSQLELAGHAEISQRHLSFLELARAIPSRQMVLRLAAALDVPLRQQNALLVAAGFAPIWRQSAFDATELASLREALDYMLRQQEPYPAVVVDRHWNLMQANQGVARLVEFIVGPLAPDAKINLADALVAPDVLRPYLINWTEVVRYFVRSVEADATADGTAETATLLERLLSYHGVRESLRVGDTESVVGPVLPMHFRKGEVSLRLFTAIAMLGTPQDVTAQELRIELFFPVDAATAEIMRRWARP